MSANADDQGRAESASALNAGPSPLPAAPKGVGEAWGRGQEAPRQDSRPLHNQRVDAHVDTNVGPQVNNGVTTVNTGSHTTNSTNTTNNGSTDSGNINCGNTYNTYNFDPSWKSAPGAGSFQEDLRQVNDVFEPLTAVDAETVERYASVLLERRVLVILHRSAHRREALSAMRAVLREARRRAVCTKLLTSGGDNIFSLGSFYRTDPWLDEFQHSIVFLDRDADATALDFCDSPKREMLRAHLTKMDSRLVLTVETELRDEALKCPEDGNWFVVGEATVVRPTEVPTFEDVFESTVVCCASLLPALPVDEFVLVIDKLVPPSTVAPSPSPPPAQNAKSAKAKPPKPTREQRWRSGDRDSVLRELGVSLAVAGSELSVGEGAGLVLSNEEQRMTMPGVLLTKFPILIRQHVEALTTYYFCSAASARFRKNYLDLLFRLDVMRIMPITSEWILRQYDAIDRRESPLEISLKLTQLLVKAIDRMQGEALVIETLHRLVDGLIACERKLLDGITERMFAEALATALAAGHIDTDVFWAKIIELYESSSNAQVPVRQVLMVLDVLIKAAQHLPAEVARELLRVFDDSVVAGTQWERVLNRAEMRWHGPRLARLALQWLLAESIKDSPLEWAAFSQVVVERFESTSGKASDKASDKARSAVAQALAIDSLSAVVDVLDKIETEPLPDALYNYLTAADAQVRVGQRIGKLMVKGKVVQPVFVESLFRSLVIAFRARDGATEEKVTAALIALAAPVRAAINARDRYELSQQARAVQQVYLDRRNYFVATCNREQAQVERDRLAIMKIVIRVLSGPLPASAA